MHVRPIDADDDHHPRWCIRVQQVVRGCFTLPRAWSIPVAMMLRAPRQPTHPEALPGRAAGVSCVLPSAQEKQHPPRSGCASSSRALPARHVIMVVMVMIIIMSREAPCLLRPCPAMTQRSCGRLAGQRRMKGRWRSILQGGGGPLPARAPASSSSISSMCNVRTRPSGCDSRCLPSLRFCFFYAPPPPPRDMLVLLPASPQLPRPLSPPPPLPPGLPPRSSPLPPTACHASS